MVIKMNLTFLFVSLILSQKWICVVHIDNEIDMKVERIVTDVLVIGSGIAGLQTALEAWRLGNRVIIVSKSPVGKANNTSFAGGGFTFATESFTPEEHFQQTLKSGRMINDRELVACMADYAPVRVEELVKMGLEGDFRKTGFWCQSSTLVGGTKISKLMVKACRETGIRFFENIMITDLIVADSVCRGAMGFISDPEIGTGSMRKLSFLQLGVREQPMPKVTTRQEPPETVMLLR